MLAARCALKTSGALFAPLNSRSVELHRKAAAAAAGLLATTQYRQLCSKGILRKAFASSNEKAEIEIGLKGRLANVVPPKRCREVTHRIGSKFGGSHSLKWITQPKHILLVKKHNDKRTADAAVKLLGYIHRNYPDMNVVVERELADEIPSLDTTSVIVLEEADKRLLSETIDLVVTLGGDGTVLHVASLFARGAVPPVLGLQDFEEAFEKVIRSEASLLLRMRLQCAIYDAEGHVVDRFQDMGNQALNEVHLHRGNHPHLAVIETYVDGQHLTEAIDIKADGLIVSTPTGSTAYSLSAGGPIVHPSVPSLMVTPICPRSLSFRSVLLPSDVCLQLRVSAKSRAPAELTLDGRSVRHLQPSEYLTISMSRYPVPCVVPSVKLVNKEVPPSLLHPGSGMKACSEKENKMAVAATKADMDATKADMDTDEVLDGGWVHDINGMLNFNKAFVTKGMVRHVGDD